MTRSAVIISDVDWEECTQYAVKASVAAGRAAAPARSGLIDRNGRLKFVAGLQRVASAERG